MNLSSPKYNKMFDQVLEACKQNFPSIDEKLLAKGFEFAIEALIRSRKMLSIENCEFENCFQ